MANVSTLNTVSQSFAAALNSKLVGEAFSKRLIVSSGVKDVFGQMEGEEGSRSCFLVKTDLSKGAGQSVNFSVSANAGHMPQRGEAVLQGKEERPRLGSFVVKVDFVRHAIALNEKVKQFLAAGASLEQAYASVLSDHLGRFKETDMKMILRNKATGANTVFPNNKASVDTLDVNDVVNTTVLGETLGNLTMLGAKEMKTNKSKAGADVLRYLIFGTVNGLKALKSNATYAAAVQASHIQENNKVIFDGGYTDWDGQGIYAQPICDPDADGPIGDPLEPRGILGTAIAPATTTFDMAGGGLPGPDAAGFGKYFRWFLGYDYPWIEGQVAAPDSATYYVVVYNVTGVDKGKFGIYSYVGTGNDGQKLTVANRLGSAAAGIRVTSLAGQTFSASLHTETHPAGSQIIQVNAKCRPVSYLLGLGVGSGLRAYGAVPMKRITQDGDYGFDKGLGYESIYGQGLALDTNNQCRSYTLLPVAYTVPGVVLTTT